MEQNFQKKHYVTTTNKVISIYLLPPFFLFLISALVIGPFVTRTGFYWDDWPVVWAYHSLGPKGLAMYFHGNRPLSGWIYSVLFPLLGYSPAAWHALSFILWWLISVFVFFSFRALWPGKNRLVWIVALFALLYPGFTQHQIALTYIPQQVSLLLVLISLMTTMWSLKAKRFQWFSTVISLISGLLGYAIIEYFFGIEFMRPVMIMLALQYAQGSHSNSPYKEAFRKWIPYGIAFFCLICWRLFFFHATQASREGMSIITGIASNPVSAISSRVFGAIRNLIMASLAAWARPIISPDLFLSGERYVRFSWVCGICVVVITTACVLMMDRNNSSFGGKNNSASLDEPTGGVLLVGLISVLFAGLPLVFAEYYIDFDIYSFSDRYTLPYLLGFSLILPGLIAYLKLSKKQELAVLSIFIFFFASFQFRNAVAFHRAWDEEKSIFWQCAWRMPNLQKGTSLFVYPLPPSIQGNHGAGLMNLLYDKKASIGHLDYFIFDLKRPIAVNIEGLERGFYAPSFKPGKPVAGKLRMFRFLGSTSRSIVVWLSPSGSVRFVDSTYKNEIPNLPPAVRSIAHLSHMEELVRNVKGLPDGILLQLAGPEPQHDWIYYYQRAELGRQLELWDTVAGLGDEVRRLNYQPYDVSEWFPFIEGYAMLYRFTEAFRLTDQVLAADPRALDALSELWLRIIHNQGTNQTMRDTIEHALSGKLLLSVK
ncbi:MAG: hypothetical protein ABSA86_07695 [Oryzomonas sp.]